MNLANSVDYALKQVGPPVELVYKRTTVAPTGNALLGIYPNGGVTRTDTLLNPQPVYTQLQDRASVLSTSNLVLDASDYEVVLSVNSITLLELESPSLTLVLKDPTDGSVEEYRILGFNASQFQGKYVAYLLYMRRKTTN